MTFLPENILPDWAQDYSPERQGALATTEERMRFAIELSRRNVEQGSGGPFGAAIFESETGRLVSLGVNRVVAANCSLAHAEMTAIAMAQERLGVYDLGGAGLPEHELVTSCEPCAMCFGAIPWSGVKRVVCAATVEDAQAIGFDEGPKPGDWIEQLTQRGIEVVTEVLRPEAAAVLNLYKEKSGQIYNGRDLS